MNSGVWRHPPEESTDLYPGLVVHDGRQTGAITLGPTRLPVNAVIYAALLWGWGAADEGHRIAEANGWVARDLAEFLCHLLEVRGEFGRLLLLLADAERWDDEIRSDAAEHGDGMPRPWWENPPAADAVADQLRRCLAVLEANGARDGLTDAEAAAEDETWD